MKKLMIAVAALGTLGLAACGGEEDETEETTEETSEE